MSDESGTQRPGPRRRTTRRLARHSARVIQPEAAASSAMSVAVVTDAHAATEVSSAIAGDASRPEAAVSATATATSVEPSVMSSASAQLEASPLLAALSVVADAGGQIANNHEEAAPAPDTSADKVASAPTPWIADSDRPGAREAASAENETEVQTKPKIRFPDASRRHSPRPVPPQAAVGTGDVAMLPLARRVSSVPPRRPPSLLPAVPDPVGHVEARPSQPTGEGIIRASQPAPRSSAASEHGRPDTDSDVPTRPRIPLTHDMALAAGRLTSLEVPVFSSDDGLETSPRISVAPPDLDGDGPAVVVTRAQMITGAPPPDDAAAQALEPRRERPSRRVRPDSEEFETLDIEDGEEQLARAQAAERLVELRGSDSNTRAGRTPPPPPGQAPPKRTASAGAARPAPPPPPPGAAKKPAPAPKVRSAKKRAWWEVLFSDDYVRTLPRPEPALVAKQVAFMEASLGVSRGDAVLDVGCGLGQHALEFARRGYLVVALDLALSMITRAAESAQQQNLRINFLHKDIRDIGFEGTFDAVVCVGTTFGFFDDDQNRGVLQRLAHALKPGGRLLLEVVNRDYVLHSQPNLVWFEGDGCVVMEESDFNFYTSRLTVKRTMMREDGRQTESEYGVRLYSLHELGQLLKQSGFSIKEVSGQEATRGLFFGANSNRIIMLAERRASGRTPSTPPDAEP